MDNELTISNVNMNIKTITLTSNSLSSNKIIISSTPYIPDNQIFFSNDASIVYMNPKSFKDLMQEEENNKRVNEFNNKFKNMLNEI